MRIYFLNYEDLIEIHSDQIHRYGGKEGIRDKGLLLSAISQPSATFEGQYLHPAIFDKAAAYLFHICQNHPFIDGNKRVAMTSSLMFLAINEYDFDFHEEKLEALVRSVSQGKCQKDQISKFLSGY